MIKGKTANDYRAQPWPVNKQAAPAALPKPGGDYPRHIKCADGATRTAHSAEHEEALKAIPGEPIRVNAADLATTSDLAEENQKLKEQNEALHKTIQGMAGRG